MVKLGAIDCNVRAIEYLEAWADQVDFHHPVPHLLNPVKVRLIAGVCSQSSTNIDEAAVRDAVLVIVALVEGEDLPAQATAARLRIPPNGLAIKHCLRERQPLRLFVAWVLKLELGGAHRCHAPEGLVIVAEILGAVGRLVVVIRSNLEE